LVSAITVVAVAAMPAPKISAASPRSSAAIFCSAAWMVGLA
jgi:hypothetical protein